MEELSDRQTRGVPLLKPILDSLEQLKDYEKAEERAAQNSEMMKIAIKTFILPSKTPILCKLFGHKSDGVVSGFMRSNGKLLTKCSRCSAPILSDDLSASPGLYQDIFGVYGVNQVPSEILEEMMDNEDLLACIIQIGEMIKGGGYGDPVDGLLVRQLSDLLDVQSARAGLLEVPINDVNGD